MADRIPSDTAADDAAADDAADDDAALEEEEELSAAAIVEPTAGDASEVTVGAVLAVAVLEEAILVGTSAMLVVEAGVGVEAGAGMMDS